MKSSGSSVISQGFLNVPVKLHSVSNSATGVKFNLINPETKNKVQQQYVDILTKELVSRDNLVRGFEVARDSFIIFEKEEIKKIKESLDGRISIQEYIKFEDVNPLHIQKSYYLSTDKMNSKAYALINQALNDLEVAAICLFAYRGKEHLACMCAYGKILILMLLQYSEYTKPSDHVPISEVEYTEEELNLTKKLIAYSINEKFDYESYQDQSKIRTMELINKKLINEEIPNVMPTITNPHDILSALVASLKEREHGIN